MANTYGFCNHSSRMQDHQCPGTIWSKNNSISRRTHAPLTKSVPILVLLISVHCPLSLCSTFIQQHIRPRPSPPLAVPVLAPPPFRRQHPPPAELPQCTDSLVLGSTELRIETGGTDQPGDQQQRTNITSFVQLTTVTLGETLCMLITSNKSLETGNEQQFGALSYPAEGSFSMLHTLEYSMPFHIHPSLGLAKSIRLELHYAITGTYKFAIPAITPRCKCDCAGGDTVCSVDKYQYRNCTVPGGGGVCYRTHRSGQSSNGCLSSGKADVCCQVEIRPHRDWTFQAIRLKQPSTVLVLRYRIFERGGGGHWTLSADEKIAIPLNRGATKFELGAKEDMKQDEGVAGGGGEGQHRVEISAAGSRPHRQMEPGMYFYKIEGQAEVDTAANAGSLLRDGVALNGPGESSMEKLGWFRWERGQGWMVRKGLEKITQAQHISVEDCKAQRYRATFNAEQFVLKANSNGEGGTAASGNDDPSVSSDGNSEEGKMLDERNNFDLGALVREEPWVGDVRVGEREVVLEHAEGAALALTIRTESRPRIVHHSSQFSDFSGTIVLDKESNRYLNLTFHNARGTLIGQIFTSPDSLSVMESIFSIDIGKMTLERFERVVATSVQSPRLVCFYPIGDLDGRKCHRLEFVREPLQESVQFADHWQQGHSDCRGCNERGVESFLASMDPRQWLNGLNSPAELFTCLVELVLCVALLLLALLLLTKCVIPLCRCVRFVAKPAKTKQTPNR